MNDTAVIIVGAGPTGLALSLALARHQVPSVVLDASDGAGEPRSTRSCVLRPDTAAWLPPLETARWTVWHTRRRRQPAHSAELDAESAPVHVVQHQLETALREALAGEELATVATGSHVDDIEQDRRGVAAHTRAPADRWWRGDYLVGCDGARSTVRKLLGVRFPGRTAVERHAVAALRAELPWANSPDEALLHRNPEGEPGEIIARPLPRRVWRLDWLLPPRGDLVTPEELLDRVHDTLALWHGDGKRPGDHPYQLLDTGVNICHQRLARHWRVDRAFLAGDAAHLLGALGAPSVDEGLRDAANLAWKLALVWHQAPGVRADALLDSYETERRGAVAARLRAVDQALPLVRRGGGLRTLLPGGARSHLELLTDGHLGRGLLGAPPSYPRSPLTPSTARGACVSVATSPGAQVSDVPVTSLNGERRPLRSRLAGGADAELLVVLVAPGTGVWDSRHWRSAGIMPELAAAVRGLPLRAELLVTESYPGAAAHTVLVVRPDGHLVAALPGARAEQLRACAQAVSGGPPEQDHLAS